MTEEQHDWLKAHPNYSPVRRQALMVTCKKWTDEGWLFANGRFVIDDGKTLFPHACPDWFPGCNAPGVIRVGRHYDIV